MLSIIVVNYKTPDQLLNCITTVYLYTKNINFEVIVVDNNSQDHSNKITYLFKKLKWIQLNQNFGFAKACNVGINNAKGDVILLLNSDTLIIDNSIERCYNEFINSSYIACGIQLLNKDKTPQISGSYCMKGGLNHLLPLPVLGTILKVFGYLVKVKKPSILNSDIEIEVDWINGAFLMVKKDAINLIGKLDEDFFLYAEEAEWCSRLRKVGKLCIYGQYKVLHLQGVSANKLFKSSTKGYQNLNDLKGKQILLSNLVRIRKEFGKYWFLFHFIMFLIFSYKTTSKLYKYFPYILKNKSYFYKYRE